MHIERNIEQGILTLSPADKEEEEILQQISDSVELKGLLLYNGRGGAGCNEPGRMKLFFVFDCGSLELIGTTDKDDEALRYTRDTIFFGGRGLILLKKREGKMDFTIAHCRLCGSPMVTMLECESKVCNSCSDKCDHVYKTGIVHGGEAGECGIGEYCIYCNRAIKLIEKIA